MVRPGHNSARAFTLIEILCVVVIMGIAGAIIVPQMSSRDDLKIDAAARMLMSDLMYVQNIAISRQTTYYVRFTGRNPINVTAPNGTTTIHFTGQQYSISTSRNGQAISHPVTGNPYTVGFGPQGASGLETTTVVSAFSVPMVDVATEADADITIGFDPMGSPRVYTATGSQEMSSNTIVLRPPRAALGGTITLSPFTGALHYDSTRY